MRQALESKLLGNILGILLLVMLGGAMQMIRTPDPGLAVLNVRVEGVVMEVARLSGLIEDMRRGTIYYGNE